MTNIDQFIEVLKKAQVDIDTICKEKSSNYWDTIRAVIVDKHFILMVTKEMKNPKTTWQDAVNRMIKKCRIKIKGLQSGKAKDDMIEIEGACKYLLDKY